MHFVLRLYCYYYHRLHIFGYYNIVSDYYPFGAAGIRYNYKLLGIL